MEASALLGDAPSKQQEIVVALRGEKKFFLAISYNTSA
jgi:hypothetical protein